MMKAAKEATTGLVDPPLIIGVTMLTSLSEKDVNEIGIQGISNQVLSLASLAKKNSLDGIVCSANDVRRIKELLGKDFVTVTPGIRSSDSSKDDQSRVSSARNAIEKGADYLVIGRPITQSNNPMKSLDSIIKEIS
jgi:orotidine-5'-phosphate decarboxylase